MNLKARSSIPALRYNFLSYQAPDVTLGLGNAKKDQFYLSLDGLKSIDFGSKNMINCVQSQKTGFLVNGANQDTVGGEITVTTDASPLWVDEALSGSCSNIKKK